jgi:hypothetical protein
MISLFRSRLLCSGQRWRVLQQAAEIMRTRTKQHDRAHKRRRARNAAHLEDQLQSRTAADDNDDDDDDDDNGLQHVSVHVGFNTGRTNV